MFYTFSQNNSGGNFDFNEKNGITHFVIIEADSSFKANMILGGAGGYFYGVDEANDCPCCGDRWYQADESDATDTPKIYGEDAATHKHWGWMQPEKEICVHYADGRKVWY